MLGPPPVTAVMDMFACCANMHERQLVSLFYLCSICHVCERMDAAARKRQNVCNYASDKDRFQITSLSLSPSPSLSLSLSGGLRGQASRRTTVLPYTQTAQSLNACSNSYL